VCPDNIFNAPSGEACDDNNASNNDMCVGTCDLATCGDGFLCNTSCTTGPGGGNEQCDNGGANSNVVPNACRTNCRTAFCGDSVTDAGEACDGGGVNTPTCDSNCTTAVCGDGFTNTAAGETCDGGGETVSCDANCTARVCGDSTINVTAGEDCDDGNAVSGDGCSSTCQNGPGSGEQDAQCPNVGELTLLAGTGQTCSTNGDCTPGSTCDTGLGRCLTATSLDTGWTGISHDADINDIVLTKGNLLCEGPNSPGCGQCTVTGLNPEPDYCRCANNNRTICDQPFVVDTDDCGAGVICDCYFGAPLPLSAGNTPACVANRFFNNISGTANVDTGAGAITANLRARVFLGEALHEPCPVCGGTCTAGLPGTTGCSQDIDCDTSAGAGDGICGNYDPTPNDGNRGGKCFLGANNGLSCDGNAPNTTFNAPGGSNSFHSLDCFPTPGKNVSGSGLAISLTQTTGSVSLPSALPCTAGGVLSCPCGMCSGSNTQGCRNNADCTGVGNCVTAGDSSPQPNGCNGGGCTDVGGGEGECTTGPDDAYCDGLTRANGEGFLACISIADWDVGAIGLPGGLCTITKRRECFLNPITATGVMNATTPLGVAAFCIGKTSNGGINDTAGLPGPGRVINQANAHTFCASNQAVEYTPGVGGCP
jgi:cysteine-rich repeat protein